MHMMMLMENSTILELDFLLSRYAAPNKGYTLLYIHNRNWSTVKLAVVSLLFLIYTILNDEGLYHG